jgi:hypothetical protein
MTVNFYSTADVPAALGCAQHDGRCCFVVEQCKKQPQVFRLRCASLNMTVNFYCAWFDCAALSMTVVVVSWWSGAKSNHGWFDCAALRST